MNRKAGPSSELTKVIARMLAVSAAALWLLGCSSNQESRGDFPGSDRSASALSPEQCDANARIQAATADEQRYKIQPGDQLDITFYLNPEFNDEVIVRPDGKISLRLIGSQQAAGLTPEELAKQLNQAYLSELREPGASVHVRSMPSRQIFVSGRVVRPGSFPLEPGMTAMQAISDAGGFADDASEKSVILIRRDMCGMPHGTKLNLASAGEDGSQEDVALLPRDMIVVPRSAIGNVDLFVQQYVKNVIPVSPFFAIP
jgi:protein involved in polysaccharide export with SLBB domain